MLTKLKPKSEFSRNVLTLMTGTTIAQAIPIAISPILTRIYTPEDFGVFALYMAIASIVAVAATGRYEMAIMLPKKNEDVKSIVKLILILLSTITFITFLIVLFFNQAITNLFENPEISNWLYFLPISIFLVGLYQIYNYLLIREKNFKRLSKNKVIVSTTNASTQLGYGFIISNGFGLLFGNIISYIVSIYFIIKSKVVNKYFHFKDNSIRQVAKEYQNFPRYDVPSAFFNKVSQELPSLTIPIFFSTSILGFYSLMYRVLMSPLVLISASVEDVFKESATKEYHNKGNCKKIFLSTFKKLLIIGLIPFLILIFFAPDLFAFIFGEQWKISGKIAQIMAIVFFLRFIAKPLSYTFYIANKQKVNMIGQFLLILFTLLALFIGYIYGDEYFFFYSLSITFSIFYIVYCILSYKYSKGIV